MPKDKEKHITSERKVFWSKMAVVLVGIVLQLIVILAVYLFLRSYVIYWRSIALLLSVIVVLYIVNKQDNPAYKLAWVILVMTFPLAGGVLYVAIAGNRTRLKFINAALENYLDTFKHFRKDDIVRDEIAQLSNNAKVQADYISKTAGYPVYKNTSVKYFPLGEDNYETLMQELKNAKHFIFMEYFIIKHGTMWDSIEEILVEKASEGVDVRLIYDDFGCAMGVPAKFNKKLESKGIKVAPFNPVVPILSLRQNNRDHRKITVIDGYVGFTGGINLADEYINKVERFGHWKDTGIMLKGEAVWNLTVMFLQTWQFITKEKDDYSIYSPYKNKKTPILTDGYVLPYGDTPVDDEIVGENIYLNIINKATRYVYITTPYLIIDNEMITALSLASKSGIDVRIIVPGIADKKLVYLVTESYFKPLIDAGVKIYKYKPGFIHAKTVVADDKIATVGTVNFDYRSLYLHFECGVWMFNSSVIYEIKDDYMNTLNKCEEVTHGMLEKDSAVKRLLQAVLRVFAPLM